MASQVEIFNRAIVLLGEERITSPTQDVKAARELSAVWDTTRKALLRSYRWGFAMKRASLAALATPPLAQFDRQFLLPADFLRLDFVGEFFVGASLTDYRTIDESEYGLAQVAEGTVIETDMQAPLPIRYIGDVTDPNRFDALFVEAFAGKLAVDVASTLTNSDSALGAARQAFGMAVSLAMRVGAIERPPVPLPDDAWILGRL
jgi:hypothetical protein